MMILYLRRRSTKKRRGPYEWYHNEPSHFLLHMIHDPPKWTHIISHPLFSIIQCIIFRLASTGLWQKETFQSPPLRSIPYRLTEQILATIYYTDLKGNSGLTQCFFLDPIGKKIRPYKFYYRPSFQLKFRTYMHFLLLSWWRRGAKNRET